MTLITNHMVSIRRAYRFGDYDYLSSVIRRADRPSAGRTLIYRQTLSLTAAPAMPTATCLTRARYHQRSAKWLHAQLPPDQPAVEAAYASVYQAGRVQDHAELFGTVLKIPLWAPWSTMSNLLIERHHTWSLQQLEQMIDQYQLDDVATGLDSERGNIFPVIGADGCVKLIGTTDEEGDGIWEFYQREPREEVYPASRIVLRNAGTTDL